MTIEINVFQVLANFFGYFIIWACIMYNRPYGQISIRKANFYLILIAIAIAAQLLRL